MSVISRENLTAILYSYRKNSRYPNEVVSLRCTYDDKCIWEIMLSTGYVHFDKNNSTYSAHVIDALDICGALDTGISIGSENKKLGEIYWKEWFLGKISYKCIILDTNFVLRHYFSSVIAPHFKEEELTGLTLNMPRMVILEIERRGNQTRKSKTENGLAISGKDKRLAFYGAKEIRDLRGLVNFDMIPMYDPSAMIQFADRAGKGFSDAWIRKEIHDLVRHRHTNQDNTIFMTCDLMNSMAAEAEGLHACLFSRLTKEQYNVYSYNDQIFNFIMACSIIFEKIKIEFLTIESKVKDAFQLEGVWHGKTTADWYTDCLKVS